MTTDNQAAAVDGTVTDKNSFKVIGENKIPVSSKLGSLWSSRRKTALRLRHSRGIDAAWEQAIKYFENDQLGHRNPIADGSSPGNGLADRIDYSFAETENVVFANTVSATAILYAKSPGVEITSSAEELAPLATATERLINQLMVKKELPGVNLKPKARKAILSAFLCNVGWLELGWINKQDSLATAKSELMKIESEYANTKDMQRLIDLEGEMMALQESMSILEDEGPFCKYRMPKEVLIDPTSREEDLSDADWIMIKDLRPTSYVKARYAKDDSGKSLYEQRMNVTDGMDEEGKKDFTLFVEDDSREDQLWSGNLERDELRKRNEYTVVWTVWDKTMRRVLMFADKNWSWPLWVYDDPYELTGFFPVARCFFYSSPKGGQAKGEVTYMLDQQDAINLINTIQHQALSFAVGKLAFDSNKIDKTTAERWMTSNKLEMLGIPVPDGSKITDLIYAMDHPALKALQFVRKEEKYAAIDRVSSVSEVMRGGQFKTNTTNKAVEQYQQQAQTRYDDMIDQVEDFLGQAGYILAQLCWKNMDIDTVTKIIGTKQAADWTSLDSEQIKAMSLTIVGGSTLKPTSMNKRQEALQVAQILGQFGRVTPVAALVALRVLERAFDSVTIKEEEWKQLETMMMQSIAQPQQTAPAAAPPGQPGPATSDLPNGAGGATLQ